MNTSKKIRAVAALGTLSAGIWAGTFATFTDSGDATSTFTAGTVDIELADEADDAYGFTSIEMSNMKPGDVTYAPLKVENAGSLAFTMDMSVSATNTDSKALRDELQMGAVVVANALACDALGTGYDTAALVPLNVVVAEGALSGAAVTDRAYAAGASEVWCVKVELPDTAGNAFQAATTTATLTFAATQS